MIVSLTNGTKYSVSESQAKQLVTAIENESRYVMLQGDYIMTRAIIGIQQDEIFNEAERVRNGQHKCVHGYWHEKFDECYGHEAKTINETINKKFRVKADNRSDEEQYKSARRASDKVRESLKHPFKCSKCEFEAGGRNELNEHWVLEH